MMMMIYLVGWERKEGTHPKILFVTRAEGGLGGETLGRLTGNYGIRTLQYREHYVETPILESRDYYHHK